MPIVSIGVVVAVIALWLSRPGPENAPSEAPRPREVEAPASPASAAIPANDARPDPVVEPATEAPPAGVAGVDEPPVAPESPPASLDGARLLTGTIIVEGEDGSAHASESGSFELLAWTGSSGETVRIDVSEGRWEARVPRSARLEFEDVRLGDRPAVWIDDLGVIPVPPSGFLELRARWSRRSVLHVRSKESGGELAQVDVTGLRGWPRGELEHPGPLRESDFLARGVASPIDLDSLIGERMKEVRRFGPHGFFARSPGFAWGRTEADLAGGGDCFVDLEPGGELDVVFEGGDAPEGAFLRLWRGSARRGQPYLEAPLGDVARISLDSLSAGLLRATVELGTWFRNPVTLASGEVEVIAGQRSTLTLELASVDPIEKVAISGSLRVPKAWKGGLRLLTVQLLDAALDGNDGRMTIRLDDARSEGEFDVYAWRLESVQPGRYEIGVHDPRFSVSLLLGPEGRDDVDVTVPPPVGVSVRTVDEATGEDAPVEAIHWHPVRPEGVNGGALESVRRDEPSARFEFEAPETTIVISTNDLSFTRREKTIALEPGQNEAVLEVTRACGMLLRVFDGDVPVAWRQEWRVVPRAVDGEGRVNSWGGRPRAHFIGVTAPGRYRFEFPTVDGYEPVPEQEVFVEAGRLVEHAIQLVRK